MIHNPLPWLHLVSYTLIHVPAGSMEIYCLSRMRHGTAIKANPLPVNADEGYAWISCHWKLGLIYSAMLYIMYKDGLM